MHQAKMHALLTDLVCTDLRQLSRRGFCNQGSRMQRGHQHSCTIGICGMQNLKDFFGDANELVRYDVYTYLTSVACTM